MNYIHYDGCICDRCGQQRALASRMVEVAEDAKARVASDRTLAESSILSLANKLAERAHSLKVRSEQCLEMSRLARHSETMPLLARCALLNLLEATLAHI